MAMLHPDDEKFAQQEVLSHTSISALFNERLGLVPTRITSSENQGAFHKVYFVSLEQADGRPWSGRDVVLRIARKTIEKIKTENEMAMLAVLRASGIPVPEVVFFCSDPDNPVGYEYNCLERIPYPSLVETWVNLLPPQLDRVLDQHVDIFIKLFSINVPRNHGSLTLSGNSGPVLEETMWSLPDIHRYFNAEPYNLRDETFATLNPTGFYTTWPDYISAFLKTYHHIVSIHPVVNFLRDILEPLQRLIEVLDTAEAPWVQRLRNSPALRGRLFHRDFHFGNILSDREGTIKGIIDWEFAGIGVSFAKRSSMMRNCVGAHPQLLPLGFTKRTKKRCWELKAKP
ncbi:kinase-like domain-containing protein [Mycena metata]|uniref:Kinase-like domain-containing protein n=1 Tax=Mycena metata TaxID=1033252 RepID=A0AAD7HA27_9AGAR|nr:kinase-like domain-containing protein [Mycena metata]